MVLILIKDEVFDLVVIDYNMFEMDGCELFEFICFNLEIVYIFIIMVMLEVVDSMYMVNI